jgi:hypothetical protein
VVDFSTMEWLNSYEAMAYIGMQYGVKMWWAKLRIMGARGDLEFRFTSGKPTQISKASIDQHFAKTAPSGGVRSQAAHEPTAA